MSETLRYREFAVPGGLGSHLRSIWHLSGEQMGGPAEPVVPDCCAELIVNLGDAFVRHTDVGAHQQPLHLVAGQITRAITIRPTGRVSLWGIRFQPWGAAPMLGFSGIELQDSLTSLEGIAPGLDRALAAVGDAPTEQMQHEALVAVLERQVLRARATDRRIARLMRVVAEHQHPFTVRALARYGGLSVRRVQLIFRDDVGLSPMQAHRITRFQRALGLHRSQPRLTWSAVAARAGYYDQAHLIHDAQDLAGQTPSHLMGEGELTQAFLSR